jgi:hypothetical protein
VPGSANGISIEVIWFDQEMIEVVLGCSNGYFSGLAEVYLNHRDLPELGDALRGFPSGAGDSRKIDIGTFDPSCASGGARMHLYCSDSVGHAIAELKVRGDGCKALGEPESVALRIPIEPAGVDAFVMQLTTMDGAIGASAFLPMAT